MLETSWSRQLGLLFGNTAHANALILTSFFIGNGFGYWVGRQLLKWQRHPLLAYAVCEGIIASWSTILLILFANQEHLLPVLTKIMVDQSHFNLLFTFLSILIFLPAMLAMGASLPFLARLCKHWQEQKISISIQSVYAVNTLGACLGVLFASFVSLHLLGLMGTQITAILVAGLCSVGAVVLAKQNILEMNFTPERSHRKEPTPQIRPPLNTLFLAGFSGFAILVLEVLYIRLFSLVFQNSTYSFGIVLFVFLLALAVGSALVAKLSNGKLAQSGEIITTILQSSAAAIVLSLLLFVMFTKLNYFVFGDNLSQYLFGALGLGLLILMPPVVVSGTLLPLLWKDSEHHTQHAQSVGTIACLNGLGAAAGAMAASFIFLPFLGLWNSFILIAMCYLAIPFLNIDHRRWPKNLFTHVGIAMLCIATTFIINRYKGLKVDQTLLARFHSAYGWIDVVELEAYNSLEMRQNIHYGLGSSGATYMEKQQTHIPLLLHPNPRSALFLGLATGITAGAALEHDSIQKITVVELIPEVIKASRYFAKYNNDLHSNERVSIVTDDARTFVKNTPERFDVIIGDLFVPWESGTGYLYTVENFQHIRSKLQPNGIFCQWLPMWQLGQQELKIIADTFAHVFPHVSLWFAKLDPTWTAIGLVGSLNGITLDQTQIEQRWQMISPKNSLPSFLSQYAGDWQISPPPRLITDDLPRIEFTAPVAAWSQGGRLWGQSLVHFYKQTIAKLPLDKVQWLASPTDLKGDSLSILQKSALRALQRERLEIGPHGE